MAKSKKSKSKKNNPNTWEDYRDIYSSKQNDSYIQKDKQDVINLEHSNGKALNDNSIHKDNSDKDPTINASQPAAVTSQNESQTPTEPKPAPVYSVKTPESLKSQFLFMDEIGHGTQGRVFKAIRLEDNKTVVIKQLNISSIKTWKEYELFHREADVLQTLNIKGVARFYSAIDCLDDEPPCSYIVQEYIPGASLQKMLNDKHRFKVSDVFDLLIQTLEILNELHHHDPPVIHRDIKPSNIMISPDETGRFIVTIIDFGAVANPQVQGGGSTIAGTIGYMPPEQLMQKPVPASDVYAVGALAVQLFSGKSPADIPVKDFRLIFEPEMQDKPHALVTTLRQMLEPKVDQRFADIPRIIELFKDYKDNRFDVQIDLQSFNGTYTDEYEQKLKNLSYISEPGSMDLWQSLPDSNRSIPVAYQNKLLAEYSKFEINWKNVILFTILFAIVPSLLYFTQDDLRLPILIAVITVIFFVYRIIQKIREERIKRRERLLLLSQHHPIPNLILNGRKTIARITDIVYLMCDTDKIERLANKRFQYNGDPIFQVKYTFNPPDDKRAKDITHSFLTNTEPENHYKIGDPLSILYRIDDNYFEDTVTSMPYPVPLSELEKLKIVDASNSNSDLSVADKERLNILMPILHHHDTSDPYSMSQLNEKLWDVANSGLESVTAYKMIMPFMTKFLDDETYSGITPACIYILKHVSFASDTSRNNLRIENALSLIINYLNKRPRTAKSPNRIALESIIKATYFEVVNGFFVPDVLWNAFTDIYIDYDTPEETKDVIVEYLDRFPVSYIETIIPYLSEDEIISLLRKISQDSPLMLIRYLDMVGGLLGNRNYQYCHSICIECILDMAHQEYNSKPFNQELLTKVLSCVQAYLSHTENLTVTLIHDILYQLPYKELSQIMPEAYRQLYTDIICLYSVQGVPDDVKACIINNLNRFPASIIENVLTTNYEKMRQLMFHIQPDSINQQDLYKILRKLIHSDKNKDNYVYYMKLILFLALPNLTDATKVHHEFLTPIIQFLESDDAKSEQSPNPELIELICNRICLVMPNYTVNKRLIRTLAVLYQSPDLPQKTKDIFDEYKNNHLSFFDQIKLYIQMR